MNSVPIKFFHAFLSGVLLVVLITLLVSQFENRFIHPSPSPVSHQDVVVGEEIPEPVPSPVANAASDTDDDGIPDEWETIHHHDPGNPADADADFDRDGLTAKQEFLAGTNPCGSWKLNDIQIPSVPEGVQMSYWATAPNAAGDFALECGLYEPLTGSYESQVFVYDASEETWQQIDPPAGEWSYMGVLDINDRGHGCPVVTKTNSIG